MPTPPGVRTAVALGALGLLPFFAAAIGLWAGPQRLGGAFAAAPITLLAYPATIASFLAGVRWGVEAARGGGPRPAMLAAGVLPQLGAFGLVAAPIPTEYRFAGLALLLVALGAADMRAPDLPDWYRRLRLPLTVGAAASVACGFAWTLLLRPR